MPQGLRKQPAVVLKCAMHCMALYQKQPKANARLDQLVKKSSAFFGPHAFLTLVALLEELPYMPYRVGLPPCDMRESAFLQHMCHCWAAGAQVEKVLAPAANGRPFQDPCLCLSGLAGGCYSPAAT
jgi:hypothetical protein